MASFLSFLLGEKKKTASIAKERLQIILAHERNGRNACEPDYLPALQRELVAVISKYVKINPEHLTVHLERQDDLEVLEVKIELPDSVRGKREGWRLPGKCNERPRSGSPAGRQRPRRGPGLRRHLRPRLRPSGTGQRQCTDPAAHGPCHRPPVRHGGRGDAAWPERHGVGQNHTQPARPACRRAHTLAIPRPCRWPLAHSGAGYRRVTCITFHPHPSTIPAKHSHDRPHHRLRPASGHTPAALYRRP